MTTEPNIFDYLPCPFCGEKDNLFYIEYQDESGIIYCDECQANGPCKAEGHEATAAWNERHGMIEWIKCSDRLPDVGDYVIVTDGHHVGEATCHAYGFLVFNHWRIEPWEEIKLWMPLPQPPKGDE